jgi:tRNA-Thr(GGU) m(6)t(6)A37 methyltransferase TsaA
MKMENLSILPIGIIHTPFHSKYSAPRQPASAVEKTVGTITLTEHRNFEQALEDIKGFEYIWLIFWFHKNRNWKPKVLPPNGGRKKHGVFSTRSPHRPNPIGLSLCKLIDVKGRRIRIENPDMLDGTPLLDIKPYIPHAESFPHAHAGWIEESNELTKPSYTVSFAPKMKQILNEMGKSECREVSSYLTTTLAHDPYPHVYRRIKVMKNGTSVIAVKRWRFKFKIIGMIVRILDGTQTHD